MQIDKLSQYIQSQRMMEKARLKIAQSVIFCQFFILCAFIYFKINLYAQVTSLVENALLSLLFVLPGIACSCVVNYWRLKRQAKLFQPELDDDFDSQFLALILNDPKQRKSLGAKFPFTFHSKLDTYLYLLCPVILACAIAVLFPSAPEITILASRFNDRLAGITKSNTSTKPEAGLARNVNQQLQLSQGQNMHEKLVLLQEKLTALLARKNDISQDAFNQRRNQILGDMAMDMEKLMALIGQYEMTSAELQSLSDHLTLQFNMMLSTANNASGTPRPSANAEFTSQVQQFKMLLTRLNSLFKKLNRQAQFASQDTSNFTDESFLVTGAKGARTNIARPDNLKGNEAQPGTIITRPAEQSIRSRNDESSTSQITKEPFEGIPQSYRKSVEQFLDAVNQKTEK